MQSLLQHDGLGADSGFHFNGNAQFAPRAKNVIWLFMRGGVSHMESFDPKPALTKFAGQSIPNSPFKNVQDPEKLKKVRVVVVNDANGQQRDIDASDWDASAVSGTCLVRVAWLSSL